MSRDEGVGTDTSRHRQTPGAASCWEETRAFVQRALGSWQLLGGRPSSRGGRWLRLMVKVERLFWQKFLATLYTGGQRRPVVEKAFRASAPAPVLGSLAFQRFHTCHQSRSWRWNPNVFPIPTRGLYRSGIVTPVPQDVMWSPQLDCALRSQSCGQCKILAKFSGMDALRGNCGILRTPFAAASPTSFRIVAQEWVEVKYLDLGSWFRLRHNGSNLHVQIFKTFILSMPWLFWHLRPAVPSQRMRALLRAEVSFFPSRVLTSVARKMGPL